MFNNLSHHAYLLIGDVATRDEVVSILEEEYGLAAQGNPDFFIRNFETFVIGDARELKALHSSRPVGVMSGGEQRKSVKKVDTFVTVEKKVFILTMNGITIEAQNALLKLLEEPAEYAHFFLIVPSAHILLPTVKSRMLLIEAGDKSYEVSGKSQKNIDLIKEAEIFIKANQSKRLDIVKALVDAITKEKKTKQDAIDFLHAVERTVFNEYKKKGAEGLKEGKATLEAIEKARDYLNDRAPSVKMLLEYVALNL